MKIPFLFFITLCLWRFECIQSDVSTVQLRKKKAAIESGDYISLSTEKLMHRSAKNVKNDARRKLYEVKEMVDEHMDNVYTSITDNAVRTIEYVQKSSGNLTTALKKSRRSGRLSKQIKLSPSLNALSELWDQVAASTETDFAKPMSPQKHQRKTNEAIKNQDSTGNAKKDNGHIKNEKIGHITIDTKLDRFRRQNALKVHKVSKRQKVRI